MKNDNIMCEASVNLHAQVSRHFALYRFAKGAA